MSDSVRPHRRQPTRLPRPWDSPGKNTGVGCHLLLQCRKVKSESQVTQSCQTLSDPMDCSPPGSSVHGIFQARVLEWGAIAFSVQFLGLEDPLEKVQATHSSFSWASLVAQMLKNLPAMRETWDSIPGLGRSPGGGYGNPLQYPCLENPHGQRSLVGYNPRHDWVTKHSTAHEDK